MRFIAGSRRTPNRTLIARGSLRSSAWTGTRPTRVSPAPGLRVPDAQANPHILPGSDRRSLVRAVSADGHSLVYDRPPQPQEATRSQIGNARTLALARLGTGGVITTTSLEGLDPNGNGVLNDNGLWWYSSPTPSGLLGYEVFYVDLASNQVTQVSDLSAGKRVLAVDPARSQVIIAQGVGEQTILWLADPTGMVETSLRLVTGDVTEASISDDGQWLLYITQQNGDEITTTVYVLPLAHDKLRQWMRDSEKGRLQALNWSDVPLSAHISATFLPSQGQGHTQAIVNRSEGNVESIEVYNLDNGGTDFVWRSQTDGTRLADTAGLSADGGYLVYRRQLSNNASLELLDLQAKGVGWSDTGLPAGADQLARVQIAPRADYVIASLLNPEGMDRGISQALYSIPIEAGSRLGEATLIARPDLPNTQELPTVAVPSGGHVLAYTTPGKELHAVFFDGTGDKVLAKHVAAVWSLGADKALSWWR